MEIRHESFLDERFVAHAARARRRARRRGNRAHAGRCTQDVTADFMYLRLHGDRELYRGGYSDGVDRALGEAHRRLVARAASPTSFRTVRAASRRRGRRTRKRRDVYCYFDNTDVKLRAPADARSLMRCLGLTPAAHVDSLAG